MRCTPPGREVAVRGVMIMQAEAKLLEVVGALGACRGGTDLLHRREQQPDQDRDDRNHHEQFNQCETEMGSLVRHGDNYSKRRGSCFRIAAAYKNDLTVRTQPHPD